MRRSILAIAILTLFGAFAASAADVTDVTGKWVGQMGGADGNAMALTFNLKQDGNTVTGSVDGPQGDPLPIANGKIEDGKITFSVSFDGGGGAMTIVHEGTVKGDEMTLNVKMPGGQQGGPGGPITLKRVK